MLLPDINRGFNPELADRIKLAEKLSADKNFLHASWGACEQMIELAEQEPDENTKAKMDQAICLKNEKIEDFIPRMRADIKKLLSIHGDKIIPLVRQIILLLENTQNLGDDQIPENLQKEVCQKLLNLRELAKGNNTLGASASLFEEVNAQTLCATEHIIKAVAVIENKSAKERLSHLQEYLRVAESFLNLQ